MTPQVHTIGDMQVEVIGQGPAIVFCHGFTTTAKFWREQIAEFAPTHTMVLINLPGHGPSARPTNRTYTIRAFVRDLELVFSTLKLSDAVLVGLSMGGTISQYFAQDNPQLLRALILVGATPHGLGPAVHVHNVIANIEKLGAAQASKDVVEQSFGSSTTPELLAFAKNEVTQTPDFVARMAITSLNEADTRPFLAYLKLPTLVICGEEDRITPPEESRALADGIKGAELIIVKRAAHFPMLEKPKYFNAVVRSFIQYTAM